MEKIRQTKDGEITIFECEEDGDNEVVYFTLSEDKQKLEVMEACDLYYTSYLNKEEVEKLIEQLTLLKDKMV